MPSGCGSPKLLDVKPFIDEKLTAFLKKNTLGYRDVRLTFFPGHCILIGDPALPQRKWLSREKGRLRGHCAGTHSVQKLRSHPHSFLSLCPPPSKPSETRLALFSECIHHLTTSHPSPTATGSSPIISLLAYYDRLRNALLPRWPH